EILKYFLDTVEPMHQKYIEPTITSADMVVSNEYIPFIESRHTKFKEYQLKFDISDVKKELLSEILLSHGGDYLGRNHQEDSYFNPSYKDHAFDLDNEIVMIRRFAYNDRYILTYKGPNYDRDISERYILSFFIDKELYESFHALEWEEVKTFSKERSNYYFYGNLFSIDVFESGETYLEIRIKDRSEDSRKQLEALLQKMGLDITQGISDSYLEIFTNK
ncbi:CYTH domain-containing protein, partial [Candidatus Gracilibacteria bacterium]|nr:CYTH domain-containing protein [Candidatus Gracilibacteria bacterium]